MSQIKLHYLNKSRAFRVLWLFEHLDLQYEIIPYLREDNRAPEKLKEIHPLGRSPIVEIQDGNSESSKVLTESGYIFQYILEKYDTEKKLSLIEPEKAEKVQYYLHYAEGSLQPPLLMEYIFSLAKQSPGPFPISYLVGGIINKISSAYSKGEVANQVNYIESEIEKNKGYLVGGQFSAADILLSFPLQMAFIRHFIEQNDYPNIKIWLDKITKEESYVKAQERSKTYEP
ncbi:hypothetical protein C6P45_003465 [Maudiozyma exigua]|uniref:Glutathione S-transferase n=1 Tax=Maudiozyma exigua TaxID=34358 RepID=A0A9P6VSF5_MAUEX|nr:hypothetical protein C6P45_003465 [Kazachstania exigua]